MFFRRSTTVKYLLVACVGVVAYSEWFVYDIQQFYWPELKCQSKDESCTTIMFVADPQIQGDLDAPFPLNYLFCWDSDRYLKSTFDVAYEYIKPEVLIFLGDLMDEGSISTMEKFVEYTQRIIDIFQVNRNVAKIYMPGDNDIGGENEPVSQSKVGQFNEIFSQPSIISYQNITFYKVNGITREIPDIDLLYEVEEKVGKDHLKVVLSHYPLTMNSVFGQQVNKQILPNIYFCAHDHRSKYIKQDMNLNHKKINQLKHNEDHLDIYFSNGTQLYEIFVPTCSYRMGTSKMGYGVAVLDKNNQHLWYAVLGSPQRFPYLIVYLLLLFFFGIYVIVLCIARLFLKPSKLPRLKRVFCKARKKVHKTWSHQKSPLLDP